MAYDETLAGRVRDALAGRPGLDEKKMFGGLAIMIRGNMCCGILQSDLILRLGREGAETALATPGTRCFDFTGTPMKTMIVVPSELIAEDEDLAAWVAKAVDFAESLPPK